MGVAARCVSAPGTRPLHSPLTPSPRPSTSSKGVVLNRDPDAHKKFLKPSPLASDIVRGPRFVAQKWRGRFGRTLTARTPSAPLILTPPAPPRCAYALAPPG